MYPTPPGGMTPPGHEESPYLSKVTPAFAPVSNDPQIPSLLALFAPLMFYLLGTQDVGYWRRLKPRPPSETVTLSNELQLNCNENMQ